jgi:2-dehydro-3-deoxyglucarate aldolase/4-hydroxy-2-oxoheptanedioate aldolase
LGGDNGALRKSAGTRKKREAIRAMAQPGLKEMARSRDLKLGHFIVEFATPGIGQILKGAGCDFALFDTEHSGFGFETIKSVLRYMQAADLPTIVRVPSKEYHTSRAPPTWAPRA